MSLPTGLQGTTTRHFWAARSNPARPGGEQVRRARRQTWTVCAASLLVVYSGQSHFSRAKNWQWSAGVCEGDPRDRPGLRRAAGPARRRGRAGFRARRPKVRVVVLEAGGKRHEARLQVARQARLFARLGTRAVESLLRGGEERDYQGRAGAQAPAPWRVARQRNLEWGQIESGGDDPDERAVGMGEERLDRGRLDEALPWRTRYTADAPAAAGDIGDIGRRRTVAARSTARFTVRAPGWNSPRGQMFQRAAGEIDPAPGPRRDHRARQRPAATTPRSAGTSLAPGVREASCAGGRSVFKREGETTPLVRLARTVSCQLRNEAS